MVSHKIFRNRIHQLHCNDWSIGSRKPITPIRCCLGDLDHLYRQLAVEKKKRIGQRAANQGNPGQALESNKKLQRRKGSQQEKAKRTQTDQCKTHSGKKWFFQVFII